MGWADCGNDDLGRPIGYAFEATCDHPGCNAKIDRGLSYVCGDMHGGDGIGCGRYFCSEHRRNWLPAGGGHVVCVCDNCDRIWREENPEAAAIFDSD